MLQRKLGDIKVERALGEWKVSIVVEVRGRKLWRFGEQFVYVKGGNWRKVLVGLEEGRYRGFRVMCWRGE